MRHHLMYTAVKWGTTGVVLSVLAGCGGGSSGGFADGGIRGTGASVGPVSGFGSVFVNGIRFETDGNITSDDGISRENQLAKGMILRIEGEWQDDDQGRADDVEYDDTLRGPVEVITPWDPVTRTATVRVAGQAVHLDSQTVIRGKLVESLADGDFVRVSAWRLANGDFRASFVGLRAASGDPDFDDLNEVEIEGEISSLTEETFVIGGVTVNYALEAIKFDDDIRSVDDLENGLVVEVEGYLDADGVLVAREIGNDDNRRFRQGADDDIEFRGPITSAYQNREFTINGLTVRVDNGTEFDGGLQEADLAEGLLVQVEGEFLSDGTVQAKEMKLREAAAKVEGAITSGSIDSQDMTFEVGGVFVQATPSTLITDDNDDERLTFSQLTGGFKVEIDGIEREDNRGNVFLEALKIERNEEDDDDGGGSDSNVSQFELEGRLTGIASNSITTLGVAVLTDDNTEFDGVSRAQLLSRFDNGERLILEVEYEFRAGAYFAVEVELEEDDDD